MMSNKNKSIYWCGIPLLLFISAVLILALSGCATRRPPGQSIAPPQPSPSAQTPRVSEAPSPEPDESDPREPAVIEPLGSADAPYPPLSDIRLTDWVVRDIYSQIHNTTDADERVALTFDAGASAAPTPAILDTLSAYGIQVTFFLTGKWCEQNPELVKRILADGHEIGNHTYSHPDLRKLSNAEIANQIKEMNEVLHRITRQSCKPWFRPPYGGMDGRVSKVVRGQGYAIIRWSLDSWDAFKEGITAQEIEDRILRKVKPGDIILVHCGSQATAEALPGLLDKLEEGGYNVATVSDVLVLP